ncbi:Uncharacterised protein [uncultured archaeon]|nr:Uncharacterised protein [uncultured archaeon]
MTEVSLNELKELKQQSKFTTKKKSEEQLTTMFMPMNTNGVSLLEINTRQKFLDQSITGWREWKIYKVMALALAITAVYLLFVNVWLAAAAGGAAGWYFGEYIRRDFLINRMLKGRDLYELG